MKLCGVFVIFCLSIAYGNTSRARIVGGAIAPAMGNFPYQISLQRWEQHCCGGSILNNRWILTAAHCVVDQGDTEANPASEFQIQAGNTVLGQGQFRQVKRIIVHKQYGNYINDIALLELTEPLKFDQNIQPISLQQGEVQTGTPVLVSGWGREGTNLPISKTLKYNWLTAITQDQCSRLVGRIGKQPEVICLAHSRDNGACMGDSGGPAVVNGKLVGVASFVLGGCGSNNPDAYVKVSHYLKWIRSNMN